ncbi:MAG: DUF559 domain-containing protein [Solirubrobacteraceae bacterium]
MTRQQLLELAVPSATIAYWVTNRRLVRVHAGVYAVGHRQHSGAARAMAAVLACDPGAVLSHGSAAALWGVRPWPRTPEVTCALERRRPGIRTHRTETLITKHVRTHRNIRVTSPARTVLDLLPRLTDAELIRMVNDLRLAGHLRPAELRRLVEASQRVKALLDPDQAPTRSEFEDRFLAFTAEYGLPQPQLNVTLFGREVDALFAEEKVIVELDGWRFHQDHSSFESDRERDATAAEHGYLTIRITWARLRDDPAREAARLHTTLARRRNASS